MTPPILDKPPQRAYVTEEIKKRVVEILRQQDALKWQLHDVLKLLK